MYSFLGSSIVDRSLECGFGPNGHFCFETQKLHSDIQHQHQHHQLFGGTLHQMSCGAQKNCNRQRSWKGNKPLLMTIIL
jgi:hypothetical protein